MHAFMGLLVMAGAASASPRFRSSEDALAQGIAAYQGGYYEIAVPALEQAMSAGAGEDAFLARYFLARVYADNENSRTNHARAYELFQQLANESVDVDPEDDRRAPFVAKALIALAEYTRNGLLAIGLQPNPARAADYLKTAATVFNDEDAQFELAKIQLQGEGVAEDVGQAKHWLGMLSQKGHPGAQAFLADLYWRGKIMPADAVRALTLITIAVANAPPHERVWIEDIYQNIYCGASSGTRKQATGLVADWRTRYGRKSDTAHDRDGLGPLGQQAQRTCRDGEPVAPYTNGLFETPARGPHAASGANPPAAAGTPTHALVNDPAFDKDAATLHGQGFVARGPGTLPSGMQGVGAMSLGPAGR